MADADIDKEGVAVKISEPKVVIANNESSTGGNELGTNGKSGDNNDAAQPAHEHPSPTPELVSSEPEEDKDKESSELVERASPMVPVVGSTAETAERESENSTQQHAITNELNTNGEGVDVDAQMRTTETYSKRRPAPQPTKQRPDIKNLNHDEEEPEEKGEFKRASDAQLKKRKILTAKRNHKPTTQPQPQSPSTNNNPFGLLSLGSATAGPVPASFNFNSTEKVPVTALPTFDFSSIEPSSNNLVGSTSQNETKLNEGDAKH